MGGKDYIFKYNSNIAQAQSNRIVALYFAGRDHFRNRMWLETSFKLWFVMRNKLYNSVYLLCWMRDWKKYNSITFLESIYRFPFDLKWFIYYLEQWAEKITFSETILR